MKTPDISSAFVYNDLNGLESIKAQGRQNEDKALMAVAQQFESMFLNLVLKSVREANETMFEDSMFNSHESKFYQQMHDEQLALTMSQNNGMGLASVLYEQLKSDSPDSQFNGQAPKVKNLDESLRPILAKALSVLNSSSQAPTNNLEQSVHPQVLKPEIDYDEINKIKRFDSPEHFVQTLMPIAEEVIKPLGLDPVMVVAQAALETGWGKKIMHDSSGQNSFNLFGIKASHGWQGDTATVTTKEHIGGKFLDVKADFRAYSGYQESFRDYVKFLEDNARYEQALSVTDNPQQYPVELQKAGYATDPDYAEKILRVSNNPAFSILKQES